MNPLLPLALLIAAPGGAAPLSDEIGEKYVTPVFQQLQGALDGREPNWTPPVLPGTAQTAKLSEKVRRLWLDPLFETDQNAAFAAARSLASPQAFEPPAEVDLASLLPSASISPETEELVSTVERRFLSRLFPAEYALRAAAALGSGRPDEAGPPEPALDDLARLPPGSEPRFARPEDFARRRKVADSTSLTRGSAGAAARPKLKEFRSNFSPQSTAP
ncbi:MAG: hypothetical protein ACHQ49_09580 [Elusimicrobiota bacterium]